MKKIWIFSIYKHDGLECFNKLQFSYVDAIEQSWAVAYMIPCNTNNLDHFIDECDGFIFPGADEDICPSFYGQEPSWATDCVMKNDSFLLDALDKVFHIGKPIMGICKWHQLLNIYFGWTLIQSLENTDKHMNRDKYSELVHDIDIEAWSFLHSVFKSNTIWVNSIHHQAIDTLWKDLKITATSTDNCIEAIEYTWDQLIFGVQWHPEVISKYHLPIFQKFIEKI